ncbi:hypothetical protein ACS0TY_018268 [Phlomoides rotata]
MSDKVSRPSVYIAMNPGSKGKGLAAEEDKVVLIEDLVGLTVNGPTSCLIGKVLTKKKFNAFGFLETMKKAMNTPPKGFIAKETGPNLFFFHFQSQEDLREVLRREPCHFEKNIVSLKELDSGEQPSAIVFSSVSIWVRMYDLLMSARSEKNVRSSENHCGEIIEIDPYTMDGVGRSIRIKIQMDITKPIRSGILIANREGKPARIPLKYERLPSFCFFYGLIGHMKRECNLWKRTINYRISQKYNFLLGNGLRHRR